MVVMPVKKCALCLETCELCDSHFLPAGFYRILNESEINKNPVLVNKTVAVHSSAQARAHLLCTECEGRFNQGGENWVLKNCWRSPTNFRLHSALTRVDVLLDDKGFRVYEGKKVPGVEIDKLAYFGASIFWRASVHTWPLGNTPDPRLSLGPYRNALRLYLLGKTGIPDGVVLLVFLRKDLDWLYNQVVTMPFLSNREPEYRRYKFVVPGLTFDMLFGMRIPKTLRRTCSARSGFLYMSESTDADMLEMTALMVNRAESKGKFARSQN